MHGEHKKIRLRKSNFHSKLLYAKRDNFSSRDCEYCATSSRFLFGALLLVYRLEINVMIEDEMRHFCHFNFSPSAVIRRGQDTVS